jgi:VanZ family protein
VLCVTLYPFNFAPANGIVRLSQDAGLYFDGNGIAYSKQPQEGYAVPCWKAISIEIDIKERKGSNNCGPRDIVSLYDGAESPPLLIGMYFGQIFLYSRFEHHRGQEWSNQFRPKKNILQGEEYYITAVYGDGKKALYCNGTLVEERSADLPLGGHEELCGRIIVGSSPFCKYGWMGEIRGIAIYDYALSSTEVSTHYKIFYNQGIRALAGMKGLYGLYSFHTKKGDAIENIAGAAPALHIPETYSPVKKTIMHNQRSDMRIKVEWIYDFFINVFMFIPSGFLLARYFRCIMINRLAIFFFVFLVCAVISFGIETAQIFIPARYPSMYDVFANVLGAVAGASVNLALSIIRIQE